MFKKVIPYLLVALGAIIVYDTLFNSYDIKTDVDDYKKQILALEQKVDSLHSQNSVLEFEADSLEVELEESDNRIKQLNTRIYVIKKSTKKQLDAVDLFGDDELEKFFSKRYQESDSIN